jgi:predicted DNA-binding WGR domain protein
LLKSHWRSSGLKRRGFCGKNGLSTLALHGWSQGRINAFVYMVVAKVAEHWSITKIVSGGQTGADIAGLVAAVALQIPAIGTLPHGFRQRDEQGNDHRHTEATIHAQIGRGVATLAGRPLGGRRSPQGYSAELWRVGLFPARQGVVWIRVGFGLADPSLWWINGTGLIQEMRWTALLAEARLWVMDHRSFSNLVLHRIDAARNMARFYAMSIEPTLFGGEALVRNWGRIGTQGRYRIDLFEDEVAAARALARLARVKCGRGYVPVPDTRRALEVCR